MLWPHQQRMLDFSLSRPMQYSLMYAGMGAGKTLYGLHFLNQFTGWRLVLCPKPALGVWREDYNALMTDAGYDLLILDKGTVQKKQAQLDALDKTQPLTVVVNYETAARLNLARYTWGVCIADEAQRLAAYNSKQSIALSRMLHDVPQKVAMTGTPYHDGYERLYGMTRYLDCIPFSGKTYPQSRLFGHYDDFLRRFCNIRLQGYAKIITGYKNLRELADIIRPFTMVTKTEDVIDLPDAVTRVYHIDLPPKLMKAYRQLEKESAVDLGNDEYIIAPHVLTRLVRLQQLVSSGELIDPDGRCVEYDITPRLNALSDILEDIDAGQDEPVVVFTKYQSDVKHAAAVCDKLGLSVAYLTGEHDNHEDWKQGQHDVLIANLKAGSEGVRLQRARHVVFWSVGYSLKEFEQAHARVRRHGQVSKTVYFHYLVGRGTIDETLYKRLAEKQGQVSELDKELLR